MSQKSIAYDGSKSSRAGGTGIEQPLALDRGAVGGERVEPMGHHVVGEQAHEQVRQQAEVVDAAPGEVVEAAERHPAAGAGERHRVGVGLQVLPPADPHPVVAGRGSRRWRPGSPRTARDGSAGSGRTPGSSRRPASSWRRSRTNGCRRPSGARVRTVRSGPRDRRGSGATAVPIHVTSTIAQPCHSSTATGVRPWSDAVEAVGRLEVGRRQQRTVEPVPPAVVRALDRALVVGRARTRISSWAR